MSSQFRSGLLLALLVILGSSLLFVTATGVRASGPVAEPLISEPAISSHREASAEQGSFGHRILGIFFQLLLAAVVAVPVACLAWTVTREEMFRELRDVCLKVVKSEAPTWKRKLCYLFTCEYCFSHYVAAIFVFGSGFTIAFDGLIGLLIAWLTVVWIANHYMSIYLILRQRVKKARLEAEQAPVVTHFS